VNILEAMTEPGLFGPWFKRGLLGDSWATWRVFLAVLFGLPLTEQQRTLYAKHTGRTDLPATAFGEAYAIVGRRGGKSLVSALIATYAAAFRAYPTLQPGETALVMLLASDRAQAKILLRYINAFFDRIPVLSQMVAGRTAESIALKNGISIEVHTSDYRAVRGPTIVCCICDELAFWQTGDSASPDKEVLDAVRPAMSTIPNAILLGASSPYARRGSLFEAHKTYFGQAGAPVLVWQGATREMNPSVSRLVIAAAYVRDPASARAEYGAEFRSDISSFVPVEALEACIVPGRFELPRISGKQYFAFTDPSGGSSDSFTLAIAHAEDDGTVVLDLVRETVPPFSPDAVITEDAAVLKKGYGLSEVEGDRYAGEFPRELFAKCGVHYKVAERTRSELYLELLPGLMSGRVRLLDNKRLIAQLSGLERRTARAGKDSIDHGPGAHDDVANAAAGAIVAAMGAAGGVLGLLEFEKLEASGQLASLKMQEWNKEFLFQFEAKIRGLQPTPPAPQWKEDPLPGCPTCKATIVTQLSTKEFRCQECATQFFKEGQEPKPGRGQRSDYLAGRIPQARQFRFPGQGR
jgi:hypothetical protein